MLSVVLKDVLNKANLAPEKVQEVVIGNVLLSGCGTMNSRMAMFTAGIPPTTNL